MIRSTFIYGPPDDPGPSTAPFIAQGGKAISVLGSGAQRYAPVFVGDVAEVLIKAALDSAAPTGTFALAGPDVLTVDEFVQVVNRGDVKVRHLQGRLARVLAHVLPTLTPALVEVMSADSLPDTTLAAGAFGIDLHAIRDVYRDSPVGNGDTRGRGASGTVVARRAGDHRGDSVASAPRPQDQLHGHLGLLEGHR